MNLFRKAALTIVRRLGLRSTGESMLRTGASSHSGVSVNESGALNLSAFWACVNLIAGVHGTLPAFVYKNGKEGDRVLAKEHPLYRLLHDSPNFDQTAYEFWEFIAASVEMRGNSYARIERSGSRITALIPIRSDVQVRRIGDGSLRYRWTEEGAAYDAGEADIFHLRGFGGDDFGGASTLSYARNTLGLAMAMDQAAGKALANGMRPSGALIYKDFLSSDNRAIAQGVMLEKFIGAENTGRPMVLEGGVEWKNLAIPPADAQLLESRYFAVEEICRFFGVPPFLIGQSDKASGYPKSLQQQVLFFQKFALAKRVKRLEQAINKQLLTAADRAAGVHVEFAMEALLRGDTTERSNWYRAMTQIGAMTINEVRALENLPAVAGGDVPRMQIQNVPIDSPLLTEQGQISADEQGDKP